MTEALHSIKVNSKLIIALTVKYKVIKHFKEHIGKSMHNLGLGDEFLDTISRAWTTQEKKW